MIGRLAALLAIWGGAAAGECRLALVLAMDVSLSVDAEEERLQREGLARALESDAVARAVEAAGPVALHAFEWSGPDAQAPLWPGWEVAEDAAALRGIAARVRGAERAARPNDFTAVGAALAHAAAVLTEGPACRRRVVDLSGDGESNDGPPPAAVAAAGALGGLTVNGLLIGQGPEQPRVAAWFAQEVLRGPGAFLMTARDYADVERAMTAKLVREIEARLVVKGPR